MTNKTAEENTVQPSAEKSVAPRPQKPTRDKKKVATPPPSPPDDSKISRREFLNYAWLASLAVFSLQSVGISLWFAFPNFKKGDFGGKFSIGLASDIIPEVNSFPVPYTDGKFWITNVDMESMGHQRKGVTALYKVCTHLGCLYNWIDTTHRYECPCHGSKFTLAGDYISGPARRSLDRFIIEITAEDGTTILQETDAEGGPMVLETDKEIMVIDTGKKVLGSSDIIPRAEPA